MPDPSTTMFAPPLRLEHLAGPQISVPPFDARRETVMGRGVGSDVALLHESVSRRHATIGFRGSRWLVTDLESRCGTIVNARTIAPGTPTELVDGDLLGIGPWTLRVALGRRTGERTMTIADDTVSSQRIERIDPVAAGHLAQRQLNMIIECAGAIAAASDADQIAEAVIDAALGGLDFDRAAVIAQHGELSEVEVVARRTRADRDDDFAFSRSLLESASNGQIARLTDQQAQLDGAMGASIVSLGITAAMCVPILLGESVAAYLYLDSRARQRSAEPGVAAGGSSAAVGFCQAVGRLYGLALANLKRAELEHRQQRLEEEVQAAREVQLLLLPPERGEVGPVRYAMRSRPGQFVAGDLFDVIPIDDDRAAIVIGDVVGHGIGPAVLMAAAQSHLATVLRRDADPAAAAASLNRDLAGRESAGRFITLWLAVIDRTTRSLSITDAGHGYCLHQRGADTPVSLRAGAGIPIGIDGGHGYVAETVSFGPGDRLLLFSDGLIESQAGAAGILDVELIADAVTAAGGSGDTAAVIDAVFEVAEREAGTERFTDDTTAACIEWSDRGA